MNCKLFLAICYGCLSFVLIAEAGNDSSPAADCNSPEGRNATEPPIRVDYYGSMAGHKFVRGLTNVLTGSGEIPRQMVLSYHNDGPALFVPFGFFTGVFMTIVRTGYGAVETVVFFAPFNGSYDSLLTPAYVWGPAGSPKNSQKQGNTDEKPCP